MPTINFTLNEKPYKMDYDEFWTHIYDMATNRGAFGKRDWYPVIQAFMNASDTEKSKSQLRHYISHFYTYSNMDKDLFLRLLRTGNHPIVQISVDPCRYSGSDRMYGKFLYELDCGKEIVLHSHLNCVKNISIID